MQRVAILLILLAYSSTAKSNGIGSVMAPIAQRCENACTHKCAKKGGKCMGKCMEACIDSQWSGFNLLSKAFGSICMYGENIKICVKCLSIDNYGVNWYPSAMCIMIHVKKAEEKKREKQAKK